ncbi:MAG TPA: Ig-like domain-containing protein [Candidatus Bathyarchaeia archaeon]|nr:Ig-like domain-containing protein [Candidatus Bathyarchaeia archaeon]
MAASKFLRHIFTVLVASSFLMTSLTFPAGSHAKEKKKEDMGRVMKDKPGIKSYEDWVHAYGEKNAKYYEAEPEVDWKKTYDFDLVHPTYTTLDVKLTSDRGFIFSAGQSLNHHPKKYAFLKLNEDGRKEWETVLEADQYSGIEEYVYTVPTRDGGIYAIYQNQSEGASFFVVKLDSKGEVDWQIPVTNDGSKENFYPKLPLLARDGGLLIGAYAGYENKELILIKISHRGVIEWNNGYGNIQDFDNLFNTDDKGFVVTGTSYTELPMSGGYYSSIFFKVDKDGKVEWQEGKDHHYLRDSIQTQDGDFVFRESDNGYAIAKYDQSGKRLWKKPVNAYTYPLRSLLKNRLAVSNYDEKKKTSNLVIWDKETNALWSRDLPYSVNSPFFTQLSDESFLYKSQNFSQSKQELVRLCQCGYTLWKKDFGQDFTVATKSSDGNYLIAGLQPGKDSYSVAAFLIKTKPYTGDGAPSAKDQIIYATYNTPLSGTLQANDPNNDKLTFTIMKNSEKGDFKLLDAETGKFSYIPNEDFHSGIDTVTFKVNDGKHDSKIATLTIRMSVDSMPTSDQPLDERVSKLEVPDKKITMQINDTLPIKVTATVKGGKGKKKDVTDLATWMSDNPDVLQVDKGSFHALTAGKATVTASYGGKQVSLIVHVQGESAEELYTDEKQIAIDVEKKTKVKLYVKHSDGTVEEVSEQALWSSTNQKVAEVSKGEVTALKKGKSTLKAVWQGKEVTIKVTVQ